jgi:hypothetical protein
VGAHQSILISENMEVIAQKLLKQELYANG